MTKRRRILLIAVVVLVALSTWASFRAHPREIVLIGVVDADEVVVTPPVQARLDSLWVEEGSEVKAGQPIASLDRGELAAQANAAGASAASLRAQVEQASLSARQTAGEAAGAVAAAHARVASAQADVARQDAELQRVTAESRRATTLAESGGLSPSELERATTTLHVQQQMSASAVQALRAAEADLRRAEAGELAARAARGSVVATRARLEGAQADSVAASARLGYTELRAPVSGVVQVLAARRGELV
ncbi:MAG: hypothetical protein DMD35_16495, partial [Gemmatimonadetes bacterium]